MRKGLSIIAIAIGCSQVPREEIEPEKEPQQEIPQQKQNLKINPTPNPTPQESSCEIENRQLKDENQDLRERLQQKNDCEYDYGYSDDYF